jgi:hypothetical protein
MTRHSMTRHSGNLIQCNTCEKTLYAKVSAVQKVTILL